MLVEGDETPARPLGVEAEDRAPAVAEAAALALDNDGGADERLAGGHVGLEQCLGERGLVLERGEELAVEAGRVALVGTELSGEALAARL